MKLSKTQLEVLQLMNNGWELGYSKGYTSATWLQKDGCGRGGEVKDIKVNTVSALYRKKLIRQSKIGFPITTYKLTEEAKELLKKGI